MVRLVFGRALGIYTDIVCIVLCILGDRKVHIRVPLRVAGDMFFGSAFANVWLLLRGAAKGAG